MLTFRTIKEMRAFSEKCRSGGRTIGLVPTMGALHEGHMSLVVRSNNENNITVASIFVNPAQFGPNEDFERYPRDMEGDLSKLSSHKADAVFMPDSAEMYPEGFSTSIDVGSIGGLLCGASRPGHFNAVATVVAKLFNIVTPDRAYFGQKDFQQTVVIKKLVRELDFNTGIVVCPVVRESDGLAMSSRNAYLGKEERKSALMLNRALKYGRELFRSGREHTPASIIKKMETLLEPEPLVSTEYIEIVDPDDLEAIHEIKPPAIICVAARVGSTRLIDNMAV